MATVGSPPSSLTSPGSTSSSTISYPPELDPHVRVGTLVRVQLHGRRIGGWIAAISDHPDHGRPHRGAQADSQGDRSRTVARAVRSGGVGVGALGGPPDPTVPGGGVPAPCGGHTAARPAHDDDAGAAVTCHPTVVGRRRRGTATAASGRHDARDPGCSGMWADVGRDARAQLGRPGGHATSASRTLGRRDAR